MSKVIRRSITARPIIIFLIHSHDAAAQHVFAVQVNYIKNNGFGGAMIWAIDLDDFSGNYCGGGRYPLLTQMTLVLEGSVPTHPSTLSPALVEDLLLSLGRHVEQLRLTQLTLHMMTQLGIVVRRFCESTHSSPRIAHRIGSKSDESILPTAIDDCEAFGTTGVIESL